jgi:hypothetical protein
VIGDFGFSIFRFWVEDRGAGVSPAVAWASCLPGILDRRGDKTDYNRFSNIQNLKSKMDVAVKKEDIIKEAVEIIRRRLG